jgi:tRNA A37 threonylcarbamoyladenosine dehydratase
MHTNWLERAELLIKESGIEKLAKSHVLIVGLGGVGSFAAEFIARAGIGKMTIVDGDTVDPTNINRQLPALHSTIGKDKVEVMKQRLMDINPSLQLSIINEFVQPDRCESLLDEVNPDYALDCIDSLKPKVCFIVACKKRNIPIVSSMGAGGKMNPSEVRVSDISKTYNCKLAFAVRKRLGRDYRIKKGVKAVYSVEVPDPESLKMVEGAAFKKSFYGTISFIPAAFGLHAAATVINDLLTD